MLAIDILISAVIVLISAKVFWLCVRYYWVTIRLEFSRKKTRTLLNKFQEHHFSTEVGRKIRDTMRDIGYGYNQTYPNLSVLKGVIDQQTVDTVNGLKAAVDTDDVLKTLNINLILGAGMIALLIPVTIAYLIVLLTVQSFVAQAVCYSGIILSLISAYVLVFPISFKRFYELWENRS